MRFTRETLFIQASLGLFFAVSVGKKWRWFEQSRAPLVKHEHNSGVSSHILQTGFVAAFYSLSLQNVMFIRQNFYCYTEVFPLSGAKQHLHVCLESLWQGLAPLDPTSATHMERVHSMSMGLPCQVRKSEHLMLYLGTLEPCVDTHRTVSYIAWSYWGQERSGGTEVLQMFFISGPQGKSVTTTPGSFCSELRSMVTLRHSLAIWLKRGSFRIAESCHGNITMFTIKIVEINALSF